MAPSSATPSSAGDLSSPRPGFAAPSPQAGRSWKENFHYRDRRLSLAALQRVETLLAELSRVVSQEAALQQGDQGRAALGHPRKWRPRDCGLKRRCSAPRITTWRPCPGGRLQLGDSGALHPEPCPLLPLPPPCCGWLEMGASGRRITATTAWQAARCPPQSPWRGSHPSTAGRCPEARPTGLRCRSSTWPMPMCGVRDTSCSISHPTAMGTGEKNKGQGGRYPDKSLVDVPPPLYLRSSWLATVHWWWERPVLGQNGRETSSEMSMTHQHANLPLVFTPAVQVLANLSSRAGHPFCRARWENFLPHGLLYLSSQSWGLL
ncbi:uncharacterized protein LOC142005013 isoform X2 [Carettochelys insculpta]